MGNTHRSAWPMRACRACPRSTSFHGHSVFRIDNGDPVLHAVQSCGDDHRLSSPDAGKRVTPQPHIALLYASSYVPGRGDHLDALDPLLLDGAIHTLKCSHGVLSTGSCIVVAPDDPTPEPTCRHPRSNLNVWSHWWNCSLTCKLSFRTFMHTMVDSCWMEMLAG